jgi:hypothetical protein
MIQKKKPKHTLEERGIFVRTANTNNGRSKEDITWDTYTAFYEDIWDEREHICFETGKSLSTEALSLYFHHILSKAKYPQYALQKWNIVLLHPDAHSQVEHFIDKCPRVKALTEHLKIVYG